MDLLEPFRAGIEFEQIETLRAARGTATSPAIETLRAALAQLPSVDTEHRVFDSDVVELGRPDELSELERVALHDTLRAFMPWKKGPFRIFGNDIDAEWRSDLKWGRIEPRMSSITGKRVADIGCHNGYFMFRMAAHQPELVIGFEPVLKHALAFEMLQRYAAAPGLQFELLGVEHVDLFPNFFDTVFCLGILYHHRDPFGLLAKLHQSLAPGGELIVDCQGVAGDDPVAFVPPGRYARARGIWFLPTVACLENWLRRSRFVDVETFFAEPLSVNEQRRTEWAPIDSLAEFLDPEDASRTIEGYPAPWRIYVKARRG